jgi:putative SOS response-associated peptidase YedK
MRIGLKAQNQCRMTIEYEMAEMHWGLVPRTFNARAEIVDEKPALRGPFRSRRCPIPASGFYEWKPRPAVNSRTYLTAAGDGGLAFAGLWDEWRGPEEQLLSCTIVAGRPNTLVAEIHNRMVVNLPEEAYATWLIREPAWIPCGP